MISRHSSRRIHAGAFTLLELLVSSAILLTLLVLLLGATEASSRIWNRAEQRRAPLREAGASLQLIAHDLRSAVITPDPDSLLIREDKAPGIRRESLFFLVSHSPEGHGNDHDGELCATGYFTAPPPGDKGSRNLYRFHASGKTVLNALREGKLADLYRTASPELPGTELLARHVEGLEFERLPAGSAGTPRGLRITISTVDGATALRLAGLGTAGAGDLLLKNGTSLSRIVPLPSTREVGTGHE